MCVKERKKNTWKTHQEKKKKTIQNSSELCQIVF